MLHRRMSAGALLATSIVAMSAAGCGKDQPKEKPGRIGLKPIKGLQFGKATEVSGRLSRDGNPLAGEHVRLEADEFPFGKYEPDKVATTDKTGNFRFPVKPELDTRYRAVAEDLPDTTSPKRRASVSPRVKKHKDTLNGGRVRVTIFLRHSTRISLDGLPAYNYLGDYAVTRRRGKIPFAKTTRVRKRKPGLSAITYVFRPTAGWRYGVCYPTETRGMTPTVEGKGSEGDRVKCTEDSHGPFYGLK